MIIFKNIISSLFLKLLFQNDNLDTSVHQDISGMNCKNITQK